MTPLAIYSPRGHLVGRVHRISADLTIALSPWRPARGFASEPEAARFLIAVDRLHRAARAPRRACDLDAIRKAA